MGTRSGRSRTTPRWSRRWHAIPKRLPSARGRAFVTYALRLTRTPHAIDERDIDALRQAGLDDRGIHDLACVVAYFNYVNRLASGLGVTLEEPGTR
jgi:uncharacterized peroxidase-related enzyme